MSRKQIPLSRVECDDPECVNSIEAPYYDNQHRDITAFISERGWLVIELGLGERDYCPDCSGNYVIAQYLNEHGELEVMV